MFFHFLTVTFVSFRFMCVAMSLFSIRLCHFVLFWFLCAITNCYLPFLCITALKYVHSFVSLSQKFSQIDFGDFGHWHLTFLAIDQCRPKKNTFPLSHSILLRRDAIDALITFRNICITYQLLSIGIDHLIIAAN